MDKIHIYGLIGYPISHSYSPSMCNAAFKKLKIDGRYLLFPLEPDEFEEGLKAVLDLGAEGLNITTPYKEKVIKYLDRISKNAKLIGAVNTIVVKGNRLLGDNTDGRGFVKAFRPNTGRTPKGKKIFMFGAGGAAKAVGFEMAFEGADALVVCDILGSKAKNFASRINRYTKCKTKAISLRNKKAIAREVSAADVLINATPCGMKRTDPPLLDKRLLHEGLIVCDFIYNPPETRLIRDAKRKGLAAMNGMDMLLYQGVLSFKLWTGRNAPAGVMRKALKAAMRPKPGR